MRRQYLAFLLLLIGCSTPPPPAITRIDWTDGCIALTDREIDEMWRLVPLGTPVEIRP